MLDLISFRISHEFYVYELRDEQLRQVVYIFRRGSTLFANIFHILDLGGESAVLEYDSRNQVLLVLTDSIQRVQAIRPPSLQLVPQQSHLHKYPVTVHFYVYSLDY